MFGGKRCANVQDLTGSLHISMVSLLTWNLHMFHLVSPETEMLRAWQNLSRQTESLLCCLLDVCFCTCGAAVLEACRAAVLEACRAAVALGDCSSLA